VTPRPCIGHIAGDKLGLQVAAIEGLLRRRRLGSPAATDPVWLLIERAANRQYIRMARRRIAILENAWLASALRPLAPALGALGVYQQIQPDLWAYETFARSTKPLEFTPEEETRGRAALQSMGVTPNDWFVCLHARQNKGPDDLAYKAASIDLYLPAAEWLTARGAFVLRMGAEPDMPRLTTNNPRIIDYAGRWRSDFMDVYLCAKCRFFLGSSAGLAYLAIAFDVPVAIANLAPLGNPPQSARDRFLPKLMYRDGVALTFDDIHRLGLFDSDGRRAAELGVEFRDNDSEDIISLCESVLDGDPAEAKPLQLHYRNRFFAHRTGFAAAPLIDGHFALKYQHLIGPT
jgi:putative glycosyltransferase (TIGR04372 family)